MPNIQIILGGLLVVLLFVVVFFYETYQRLGKAGEKNTLRLIKNFLKRNNYRKEDYLLISNLVLQKEDYWSCEIDILLLTRKWVYVIEVKDWTRGMLRGNYNDEYLELSYKVGKRRRYERKQVYSPFYQNDVHIKRLKSYFNCSEPNILSVVVFNGDMGFNFKRNKKLTLEHPFIVTNHDKGREIAEILASYESQGTQLTSFDFEQLKEKIEQEIITPEKTKRHRTWVKSVKGRM